jgi:hypothetical protein
VFLLATVAGSALHRGMLDRLELGGGVAGWGSTRGQLVVRHPAPGVVVFVEKGFLTSEFVAHIVDHCDRALEEALKVEVFVDGYELDGYDPEIRNGASNWLRRNAPRVIAQHMLVRSRLTKMGLSVVSLAFGGLIRGHHERKEFDADLAVAVRRARSVGATSARVP